MNESPQPSPDATSALISEDQLSPTEPPSQSPVAESEPDPPSSNPHRGNGNVARLPKVIRDKLNYMIRDGVPYRDIKERLGEDTKNITVDHIRAWKAHGYQKWLADIDRKEALRSTHEAAMDLIDPRSGADVQEAGRTVAAAQLYELLLSFDPTQLATSLAKKPDLYLGLINALARLCEGEAVCTHRRTQQSMLQNKLHPAQPSELPKLITPEALREIARQIKLL